MAQTIREFILQLGFDGSEVFKGLSEVERRMAAMASKVAKSQGQTEDRQRAAVKTRLTEEQRAAKRSEQIAVRRARLLTTIALAQRRAFRGSGTSGSDEMRGKFAALTAQMDKYKAAAKSAVSASDFGKITNSLRLTNDTLTQTIQNSNRLNRSFNAQAFAMNSARDSARNLARSYFSLFAVVAGAGSVGRTGMNLESVQSALLASSGSTKQAAKDFQFVSEVAKKFGTDLASSAKAYSQVAVAAKNAGLSAEQTKNIFLSSVEASTAFGLSAADTSGVIRAFTQIISKGTVSSEELKQQLGDRLPIAMSTAAKAMGKTVPEFTKMLELGQVIATDFLPKFSKELRIAARAGGALESALGSSRVAMGKLSATFQSNIFLAFDEGVSGGLASFFNDLRISLDQSAPMFKTLGRVVGAFFKIVGVSIRAVLQVTRPLWMVLNQITGAFSRASEETKGATHSLGLFYDSLKFGMDILGTFAGFVLLPFALIEFALNKLDKDMEDGPLKTIISGLGAIASIVVAKSLFSRILGKGGKAGFVSKMTSLGSLAAKAFWGAWLAFTVGTAVGDAIWKDVLPEGAKDIGRNFVGEITDNLKLLATNDPTVRQRLEQHGNMSIVNTAADLFRNTNQPPQQIMGTIINIDAKGMDPEQLKVVLEERFQNVFATAMEAN